MKTKLFILFQHCVPQHGLSRLASYFADCKITFIKNFLIHQFSKKYWVDLSDAQRQSPRDYISFNDFFTRELKQGARVVDSSPQSLTSPADGSFSQLGHIEDEQLFQAKGHRFSIEDLLARRDLVDSYRNGLFATIYLSPKDYHRVHMPFDGLLVSTSYIPGDLFSVNTTTTQNISNLFSRNERLVCHFETEFGPMCVILVGAMIVAGIETVWSGQVSPAKTRHIVHSSIEQPISIKKGEELGRFKLGSTAIILLPKGVAAWKTEFTPGSPIKMGQAIGNKIEN